SAARRPVTTVAPQALMLFNGDFVNEQARHLAERLRREGGDDLGRQFDLLYRLLLCRPPTAKETKALRAFVDRLQKQGVQRDEARRQVCRVLLNLNEFAYPD